MSSYAGLHPVSDLDRPRAIEIADDEAREARRCLQCRIPVCRSFLTN